MATVGAIATVSQAAPRSDSRANEGGAGCEDNSDKKKGNGSEDWKKASYTVALVADYNYGCDLNVKEPLAIPFPQGSTIPACSSIKGQLADDLPALPSPAGLFIPGRQKSNAMINDINAAGVAFSIHDGDVKSGSSKCRETALDATKSQMNGLPWNGAANPGYDSLIVYTPGDNEWTDCHRGTPTAGIQKTFLDFIRAKFFASPLSQGKTTMALTQQVGYPENVRWQRGPVVYFTINQPGSNNNFCGAAQTWPTFCNVNNEALDRNAANMTWITDAFRFADRNDAQAVVLVAQSDPNFGRVDTDSDYDINGYVDFLSTMREQTKGFEGQVVFVHGDSHLATFDHPLPDDSGVPLPNFTRVQTAGKEDTHWVQMSVNPAKKVLLSFELKISAANLGNNPNGLPWNVTALPLVSERIVQLPGGRATVTR